MNTAKCVITGTHVEAGRTSLRVSRIPLASLQTIMPTATKMVEHKGQSPVMAINGFSGLHSNRGDPIKQKKQKTENQFGLATQLLAIGLPARREDRLLSHSQ